MRLCAIGLMLILTFVLLAAPLAAKAQPVGKVPRLGVLFPAESPLPEEPHCAAFREALRHLGYVEGQTVALEYRYALGKMERVPALVADLVQLKVDILIVGSLFGAVAAQQATPAIPIVFVGIPVRIPRQSCHRFQVNPATDSTAKLPSVPYECWLLATLCDVERVDLQQSTRHTWISYRM